MLTLYTKSLLILITIVLLNVATIAQTSSQEKEQNNINNLLGGQWKVFLREADGVELNFWMTVEISRAGNSYRWEAYSHQGAAREIVGGATAFLGSLLGKLPPKEALVYIGDGTVEEQGSVAQLKGMLKSPFLGNREFTGKLSGGVIRAQLKRSTSGDAAGTMEFVRDDSQTPLRDYQKLGREVERVIRGAIYDPSLLGREDFIRFLNEFNRRLAIARDDLDAITAFQAGKQSLSISHINFIRNPSLASRSLEEIINGSNDKNPENLVRLNFPVPQVAFLRVLKWDRVTASIDKAFEKIDAAKPRILILDIRSNPGGDATSMTPLAHLLGEPTFVGAFLSRKWYEKHSALPTTTEMSGLDVITSDKPPTELFSQLRERGAVMAQTTIKPPRFDGAVYLLIDKGTASASEPLAHILKKSGRATLVGERTAGAMLTALPQDVGDGWLITVPEADFIAADGTRLEGNGVQPDIKTNSNDVFLAVADQIEKNLPFSAAMLRGASYETLKRPTDAEKAYRSSLKIADSQDPKPDVKIRATVYKRLAAILKTRGDLKGAKKEYEEVLRLVPDDAEALAAIRSNP